jgi:hypothetical protein
MKKNVWVCFLMVFILVLLPVSLFSQEEGEDEEGEGEPPTQARPDPRAWAALKNMAALKTIHIKEVLKGNVLEFDMTKIKEALEKAKINVKVTVEYINSNGLVYKLGTYAPSFRRVKRSSPINKRLINPQPEPPRFHSIPILKRLKRSTAMRQAAMALKGKALLVFKDIKGQIKATVEQKTLQKIKTIPILKRSIKQK